MAIVEGQIESSCKLREIFDENGISRFSSISEINNFLQNYGAERSSIPVIIERELNLEIDSLKSKCRKYEEKRNSNLALKYLLFFPSMLANRKLSYLVTNSGKIVSVRSNVKRDELESIKKLVDSLYSLIAGAVGESQVVKEVKKLSDDYYLINDFSIKFNPPVFNKKENDRIFSIQIDHLLIGPSGIFVLETKNWSERSLNRFDLRSPVKQILRTSYALFVVLNSESKLNVNKLPQHHWGSRKIPIRNILVMTNRKPKEEFRHVKVLSLGELTGYVKYFEQVFSDSEVISIFEELKNLTNA